MAQPHQRRNVGTMGKRPKPADDVKKSVGIFARTVTAAIRANGTYAEINAKYSPFDIY